MDPTVVQYALFILVALLVIGAVVALNRWLYRQQNPPVAGQPHTWAKLDTRRTAAREEALSNTFVDEEDEEEEDVELRVRASQNGHSSNGHKPLS